MARDECPLWWLAFAAATVSKDKYRSSQSVLELRRGWSWSL
jgi:hypothetical protein